MKQKNEDFENLPGFPKMETGFEVPQGYFDSFGERLRLRMEDENLSSHRKRIIYYLKPALGLAAGLAIMLTVYIYPPGNQRTSALASVNNVAVGTADDHSELLTSTYASLITDGQLISALTEMDEYDASKMPKEDLADYLASSCSDFEIINANK
jgi:hypothetical protein